MRYAQAQSEHSYARVRGNRRVMEKGAEISVTEMPNELTENIDISSPEGEFSD